MEPNNTIDNQFREKLNSREIKPSTTAWDRLDAMLTVADSNTNEQPQQKKKRSFGWMYIAASFIGFILIATVFLSQTDELIDVEKAPIVNETIVIPSKEEVINAESITPKEEQVIAKTENKLSKNQKIVNQETINQEKTDQNQAVASHQKEVVEDQLPSSNSQFLTETPQKKSDYANVDELLAAVKKNKKDKLFQDKATVKVNSNDLLSQVDGELELSFRQKVIKSVSKNYQEVKVALSNRNQE